MTAVDPVLRRYAFGDDLGLTREQYLRTATPSQLCDDLDAADELRNLEHLPAESRLDDVARVFRRSIADAASDKSNRRAHELAVGCVALARRTIAELELDGAESPRAVHLAGGLVVEAEGITRT